MSVTDQELIDFVVREARLLDEERYEDWLALFTADGRYWMPLEPGQTEEKLVTSLLYEDMIANHECTVDWQPFTHSSPRAMAFISCNSQRLTQWTKPPTPLRAHAVPFIESRMDEKEMYAGWMDHT